MQAFSDQQKIAIMRILMDIIEADGRIHPREVFYYNKLKEELAIDFDVKEALEEKSSLMALAQIKYFDGEQKKYLADLMANMVVVDEDINVNEVALYDVVCEYAKIDIPFNRTVEKTAN